jgi:AraC-like DNA-binding protein
MEWIPTDHDGSPRSGFKLADIQDLHELETGSYWPQLYPYFLKPEYHRIRYSILGKSDGKLAEGNDVSVRGASKAGELEVAFVADRLAAKMSITGIGLPDYCLTIVGKGALTYSHKGKDAHSIDPTVGLIYRGTPDTALTSTGAQARIAIWIPQASVKQRLSALLEAPVLDDPEFYPIFQWSKQTSTVLRHLVDMFMAELQAPKPTLLGNDSANRSFSDLLIYTLLRSLTHNYSAQLERPSTLATPGILRRAEAYMRANVEEPIALHEVAEAAGCSVRSLQLTFRNFRETTPLLAIRHFRLEAAREALLAGDAQVTLTTIAHRFGFSNPGRFTRFYKAAFGESPLEVISRRRA